jgi:large subunit ribosomal protein L21
LTNKIKKNIFVSLESNQIDDPEIDYIPYTGGRRMYAVVNINGFQYRIEKGETLRVPKFDQEVGSKVTLPEVLLFTDGDRIEIGTPYLEGAEVEATIVGQGKDKKIIIFKKKRRRDYSVKRGHRQDYTEITVDDILLKAKTKKARPPEPPSQDSGQESPVSVDKVED